MVKERKIEGYEWLTNENPTTKHIGEDIIELYKPRSDESIAREYASRFGVPVTDIRVEAARTHPGLRAVYRKKPSDKMLGWK